MSKAETGLALLAIGAIVGFVCGATIGRPEPAQAVELSVPPDSFPVQVTTKDIDGRDTTLRFACRGESVR